ncbi:hypothetical protein K504DRAFT_34271 [Pleomassaria siparia CBS 279.74]|uniref:Uncharacterized protein n=1 Tax=Pleomassaria siparia CBS 279.74 TaxID=1314801 RepID=A0A6G1KSZ4_9PLEO|nr:hypothetical protein K504DRAFT_34271 [Pleomassaria siparia CBS 279.74]
MKKRRDLLFKSLSSRMLFIVIFYPRSPQSTNLLPSPVPFIMSFTRTQSSTSPRSSPQDRDPHLPHPRPSTWRTFSPSTLIQSITSAASSSSLTILSARHASKDGVATLLCTLIHASLSLVPRNQALGM